MRLYDCAKVIRSKNAGPFTLTIDLMFDTAERYARVLGSAALSVERIAAAYGVPAEGVRVHPFEAIRTIKVTLPRPGASSGAPHDRDVYGSQQHMALGELDV